MVVQERFWMGVGGIGMDGSMDSMVGDSPTSVVWSPDGGRIGGGPGREDERRRRICDLARWTIRGQTDIFVAHSDVLSGLIKEDTRRLRAPFISSRQRSWHIDSMRAIRPARPPIPKHIVICRSSHTAEHHCLWGGGGKKRGNGGLVARVGNVVDDAVRPGIGGGRREKEEEEEEGGGEAGRADNSLVASRPLPSERMIQSLRADSPLSIPKKTCHAIVVTDVVRWPALTGQLASAAVRDTVRKSAARLLN
ncbi:hypothetical protein L249_2782 [Ophiocordyceps polyrhachis-furcata BCC 54312]|uniref:Uncharacterized protein n=1 Tax=Ophiocordyceps polyrhachis-furcata BCC 54312 TaxID=1330021 RepID=A0A367LQ94_9HYPO|nr:hypothetical protein L249_2782 [Ophiocordyceps polyrhachis-furcata BCC 54312]